MKKIELKRILKYEAKPSCTNAMKIPVTIPRASSATRTWPKRKPKREGSGV